MQFAHTIRATRAAPPGLALAPWLGCGGAALLTAGSMSAGARADMTGLAAAADWWWLVSGSGVAAGTVLVWLGVAALLAGWLLQAGPARHGQLPARSIALQCGLWALLLLPALPLFSGDAWSYLAQGEMLGGAVDPYVDGAGVAMGSFSPFVPPDWRFTGAPYGPLQLWLLHGIAVFTADTPWLAIVVLRVATCAFLALAGWSVWSLAHRFGIDGGWALWLGLANPIVVVHLVAGLHNDALALGLILLALHSAVTSAQPELRRPRRLGLLLAAGVLAGAAAGIKVTAIIAVPFMVWFASRSLVVAAGRGLLLTATTLVSFTAISLASGAGFGWIDALAVNDRVVNWLSLPTALAHLLAGMQLGSFEDTLVRTRLVAQGMLALLLILLWWRARPPSPQRAIHDGSDTQLRGRDQQRVLALLAATWAVVFVLSAVSWAWYWVFVLALVALIRPGRLMFAAVIGLVVFQLLTTGPSGSTSLYTPALALVACCAGAFAGVWTYVRVPQPYQCGGSESVGKVKT